MELSAPTLDEIQAARARIAGHAVRTPLVRYGGDAPAEIYLKLENLQPIGSFKLRGATNALAVAREADLARGVYTASAGNMAQGIAWGARARGIPCSVIVPDTAPEAKRTAIARLGAAIHEVPFAEWWEVLVTRSHPRFADQLFIHPVSERAVIAGNGTIGLELVEDLPDVDAVVVPYGGGGLASGIAAAVRALRPSVAVYGAEPDTAAPLAASLAAGGPQTVAHTPSFVDGCGGKSLLAEMWPLVRALLAGATPMPVPAIAEAVRLLAVHNRVVAEGAGAVALAAALAGKAGTGKVACIVSGGNLDRAKLARILVGEVP